jgi:hypothetical protein
VCKCPLGEIPGAIFKSFKLNNLKKLIALAVIILLYSCSNDGGRKDFLMFKAICLENHTRTYAKFSSELTGIYNEGDTVWVNMDTHMIDDKDSTTELCVLTR